MDETGEAHARFRLAETAPNPEQEHLSKAGRVLLEKALRRLRPLIVMSCGCAAYASCPSKIAVGLLDVPVGTVKLRLHRARVQLTATHPLDPDTQAKTKSYSENKASMG